MQVIVCECVCGCECACECVCMCDVYFHFFSSNRLHECACICVISWKERCRILPRSIHFQLIFNV